MTDRRLRYINRLTVFVRKLLKLVPQEKREELENEFDSILLNHPLKSCCTSQKIRYASEYSSNVT